MENRPTESDYAPVDSIELMQYTEVEDDHPAAKYGVHAVIGTDMKMEGRAKQLDIRYADGKTYVTPIIRDAEIPPKTYCYDHLIAPMYCSMHYVFLNSPARIEPITVDRVEASPPLIAIAAPLPIDDEPLIEPAKS